MRKKGKAILSVLLSAALLCGMLLPAAAVWEPTVTKENLATVNGTVWIDLSVCTWMQYDGTSQTTVYSAQDGVWLTAQGVLTYYGATSTDGWNAQTLTGSYESPDGGMLWVDRNALCYNWDMFWANQPSLVQPTELWHLSGSTIYWSVPPTGACSYESVSTGDGQYAGFQMNVSSYVNSADGNIGTECLLFSLMPFNNMNNGMDPGMNIYDDTDYWRLWRPYFHVDWNSGMSIDANSDPRMRLGYQWMQQLQKTMSFDPNMHQLVKGTYTVESSGANILQTEYAQPTGTIMQMLCIKSPYDCTAQIDLYLHGGPEMLCMADLSSFYYQYPGDVPGYVPSTPEETRIIRCGDNYGGGLYGYSYRPIRQAGVYTDTNGDGVLDETEAPGALGESISLSSNNGGGVNTGTVMTLRAGRVYMLPIFLWREGQIQSAGGTNDMYMYLDVNFSVTPMGTDRSPFLCEQDADGLRVVGVDLDFLFNGWNSGIYSPFCVPYADAYDLNTQTLTIPETIGGLTVKSVGNPLEAIYPNENSHRCSLAEATGQRFRDVANLYAQYDNMNGLNVLYEKSIQTLILPETVRWIDRDVLGTGLQRVHVPYHATVSASAFSLCPDTLVICSDRANSAVQQALTAADALCNYTFEVCTTHTVHTHTYDAEVIAPGYTAGGYTAYTCPCGETYTENATAPLPQPKLTLTGAAAKRGETVEIPLTVENSKHLGDGTLALVYDETALQLTAAQSDSIYGLQRRNNGKTLYWYGADADEAQILLTFAIAADAPAGAQTVSISGSGVSCCDADGRATVAYNAVSCAVTVQGVEGALTAPAESIYTGDTIEVTFDLTENSGLVGLSLALSYDPDVLTLTGVEKQGMLLAGETTPGGDLTAVPYTVLWNDALAQADHTEIGTILTFTFTVKETAAAGVTTVSLTYDADSTFDQKLQLVPMTLSGTSMKVVKRLPGDSDGDGLIDLKDVANLTRFLAGGWDADADARNSDVDGDGILSLRDVVILRRYLAGWDVVLV